LENALSGAFSQSWFTTLFHNLLFIHNSLRKMNIILLENIDKVGIKHEVVKVKDGFGRNYLIPKALGIVANKPNMARLDGLKKVAAKKEAAMVNTYKGYATQLAAATLNVTAKAGESGRLFGSVTSGHIATAIKAMGIDLDKRIIEMPEEVKELGDYTAIVKFHPDVHATVKFKVAAETNA
jgi:large subunit ribosomal protein L9